MPPVVDSRPLRWLIAAPLSPTPAGRRIGVSGERFTTVMSALAPAATVAVADRLGADATRSFSITLARPRDFRTRELVAKLEPLPALSAVAERLAKDSNTAAAITKIRALVGNGRLVDTLEGREPAPAAKPIAAASSTAKSTALSQGSATDVADDDDPIFGKASLSPTSAPGPAEAKNAVGSFISAMRSSAPVRTATATSTGRESADAIRQAVEATARDILAAAPVAGFERAWRSLRMVMASCPNADDLAVDAVDSNLDGLLAALTGPLSADPWHRPDAVFVVEPIADAETLRALADLADQSRVPIVVEVAPALIGFAPDSDTLLEPPPVWSELRDHSAASWLCACVGTPVLAHETEGGDRTVFGGATAAIAAIAAASVADSGVPAALVGRDGALVAPAAHSVEAHGHAQTIPTETFIAYRTQRDLAQRGVTALGSEADSDRIRLAATPMVAGEMALPARIVAGRAHRLAVAVRQALGPGASAQALEQALEEASGVFLPRVGAGDVTLRVRDIASDGATVDASIGAVLAGASVSFSSDV